MTSTDSQNAILIVGDWVVDEYWFLVRHHSEIASHPGFIHYRLASKAGDMIRDLCGAGHVARVLNELRGQNSSSNPLLGIGDWNDQDTILISHLLHKRNRARTCGASLSSSHLTPQWCNAPPDITLIPIRPASPTIRIIRLYHREKGGLEQINRVDWEPQHLHHHTGFPDDFWSKLPRRIRSIVVYDLGKGVVTTSVINELHRRFRSANWYVRSKLKNPPWLSSIKNRLELLIIGPEVTALSNPLESLLVNGKMTLQALDTMRGLPGKNLVLLSDHREAIARLETTGLCLTGKSGIRATPLTQLGWASALFAALVWQQHQASADLDKVAFNHALRSADRLAGVQEPEAEKLTDLGTRVGEAALPAVSHSKWQTEADEWHQAMSNKGIIERSGRLYLDVWRASTDLPGYIACVRKKREIIRGIGSRLTAFKKGSRLTRSLSIMLQADAGAGKTTLARSLADCFGFSFLSFDITQMLHRDDLFEMFDAVATKQANSDEKILVFVDEVNARLDGGHAFGSFLSPIEENLYVRRGKTFSLRPCVWIFVGTRLEVNDLASDEKFSDFCSRLTISENIDYHSLAEEEDGKTKFTLEGEARLEHVYLGASMISSHFSDVREVSLEVLNHFFMLDPEQAPARRIRKLAASLRNVQYGSVTRDNCEDWGVVWDSTPDGNKTVKLTFK